MEITQERTLARLSLECLWLTAVNLGTCLLDKRPLAVCLQESGMLSVPHVKVTEIYHQFSEIGLFGYLQWFVHLWLVSLEARCKPPGPLLNGQMKGPSSLRVGETVNFSCDKGWVSGGSMWFSSFGLHMHGVTCESSSVRIYGHPGVRLGEIMLVL